MNVWCLISFSSVSPRTQDVTNIRKFCSQDLKWLSRVAQWKMPCCSQCSCVPVQGSNLQWLVFFNPFPVLTAHWEYSRTSPSASRRWLVLMANSTGSSACWRRYSYWLCFFGHISKIYIYILLFFCVPHPTVKRSKKLPYFDKRLIINNIVTKEMKFKPWRIIKDLVYLKMRTQ